MTAIYPYFFALSSLAYLTLGAWVVLRQKNNVQMLYGILCITTCLWQGIWAALFADSTAGTLDLFLKICFTGVVFIPSIFYHFNTEFTAKKRREAWLPWTYAVSSVLACSVWVPHLFTNGFITYNWGISVKAGPLYPLFTILVTVVVLRTLVLVRRLEVDPETTGHKRRQTLLVKLATYIYLGGAIDIVSQYGVPLFPFSFMFSAASVILYGYAMFRYEFLDIAAATETAEERTRRHAASEEMKRLGVAAAFPLVSQGEVLGYLLLGEKMSEESYSKEDLLLLRIVANQAALAYQRVRYLEMAVHGARTEMLGEIAGGFAHEIKTPLANISLPAELSLMDLMDVEKGKQKLEDVMPELKRRLQDIMQQTVKASEKIEAVRQFSKPGQVQLEAVDLTAILANSIGLLDHLLRKTNTRVKALFPPVMSPVRGDSKQLEIVFVNLIKNAAEAMALHSSAGLSRELVLKAHEDGNWVVASIKDSGPGIKRTDIGHLFEAYFTTKGGEGTGMGLFLSRQVIKAHGGQIDVLSEEGKGTEFVIRLPKYSSQEHANVHKAA